MKSYSYNLSPLLKEHLDKIEIIRRRILITPLNPTILLKLQWEVRSESVFHSLLLDGNEIPKKHVLQTLSTSTSKKLSEEEEKIIRLRKAYNYIRQNWLIIDEKVTQKDAGKLYEILTRKKHATSSVLPDILHYLQASNENPVIQASLAHLLIEIEKPFAEQNSTLARLIARMFLYKGAYDFRELLDMESYFVSNTSLIPYFAKQAQSNTNLTLFLEQYAQGMIIQLDKTIQHIQSPKFSVQIPRLFWKLTDRQKDIIAKLEEPDATITNKRVQQLFHVSQITASRDLSHLANLGLLFPHGQGRSIFYTRV